MPPVYLESFSFSLLCTIEYMRTVLPNFHIVTILTKRWSSDIDDSDIHPAPSSDIPGPCPGRGSLNREILSPNPSNVRLSTMHFKDEGKFLKEGTPTEMALH